MLNMSTITKKKLMKQLFLAINAGNIDDVEKLLKSLDDAKLPESFMAAAEATENDDIIESVFDHISANGLEIDHNFPTQIHWALAKGYRKTAAYIAVMITDEDRQDTDENALTPLELAQQLGYEDVAAILEDQS
jgi:hypothetical protein